MYKRMLVRGHAAAIKFRWRLENGSSRINRNLSVRINEPRLWHVLHALEREGLRAFCDYVKEPIVAHTRVRYEQPFEAETLLVTK
jgi:hypothetical protein